MTPYAIVVRQRGSIFTATCFHKGIECERVSRVSAEHAAKALADACRYSGIELQATPKRTLTFFKAIP